MRLDRVHGVATGTAWPTQKPEADTFPYLTIHLVCNRASDGSSSRFSEGYSFPFPVQLIEEPPGLCDGRAGVVRNGYLPARELQTGLGPVTVKIPKVRAKTGEAVTFRSALVPPYVRKTKTLEAALPWLYLKGISSGEMGAALEVLVGPQAKGLSASTVSRLKQVWGQEYRSWSEERLDKDHWVYVWADGVYSGLRAEHTKLCALVVIGVNERGEKRFLSIEDGVRHRAGARYC